MRKMDKDGVWDVYVCCLGGGSKGVYGEGREEECRWCKELMGNMGGVVRMEWEVKVMCMWDKIEVGKE